MIEVEERAGGLRAVDVGKNDVAVDLGAWERRPNDLEIDRRVHETVDVVAERVDIPGPGATVESSQFDQWRVLADNDEMSLVGGDHLAQIEGRVTTFVRIEGSADLGTDRRGAVSIDIPGSGPLTIGFRSHIDAPTQEISVPDTPAGLATGLTAMGGAHLTDDPNRSYPTMRRYPPRLSIDEEGDPGSAGAVHRSDVRIVAPHEYGSLFLIAPLAHYLSAEVTVGEVEHPRIITPEMEYSMEDGSSIGEHVSSLLHRVFFMDCLVRNVGPYGYDQHELRLLDRLPIEPEDVYDLRIADRLDRYLDIPYERIEPKLPKWPLAFHLEPSSSNIPALPHILHKLALVRLPKATPLGRGAIIRHSLDEFTRSSSLDSPANPPGAPLVSPDERPALEHGWAAEGISIDGFKVLPDALGNRLDFIAEPTDQISVFVAINDSTMEGEFADVQDTYERFATDRLADVRVEYDLGRKELAEILGNGTDFFHYIGHCDPGGLRCRDGHLDVSSVPGASVQTFLLNACESYSEGLKLVKTGSVAGVVTLGDIVDEQARKVGRRFVRLLLHGFSLSSALKMARRRSIVARQFVVVGDQTHILTGNASSDRMILHIVELDSDSSVIRVDSPVPHDPGSLIMPFTDSKMSFAGQGKRHRISNDDLQGVLDTFEDPVIYDGHFFWPDELLDELF